MEAQRRNKDEMEEDYNAQLPRTCQKKPRETIEVLLSLCRSSLRFEMAHMAEWRG